MLGRVTGLAAGQVEGDDSALPIGNGQFGLTEGCALVPVSQTADNEVRPDAEVALSLNNLAATYMQSI